MSVQLLVIYPPPKDPAAFDRAYRDEHCIIRRSVRATKITPREDEGSLAEFGGRYKLVAHAVASGQSYHCSFFG